MSEQNQNNKIEQVAQYVRYHAFLLEAGQKMPSIRLMCRVSNHSRFLITRALTELVEAGVLECRDRSGYYRSQSGFSSDNPGKYIDIFACAVIGYLKATSRFPQNFFSSFMYYAKQSGYDCRFHAVPVDKPVSYFEELIKEHGVRMAVLFSPNSEAICRSFELACTRWVAAAPRFSPRFGPAVLESDDSVTALMEYLYRHGHRKIAFFDEFDYDMPSWVFISRREKYFRFMAENGLKVHENYYFQAASNKEKAFKLYDKMFSKNPPTAAIIPGGGVLLLFYEYCKKESIKIGEEFSVISYEKRPELQLKPSLCSLNYDVKEMAKQTLELLLNTDENKKNEICYLNTDISLGESVAKITNKKMKKCVSFTLSL